MIITLTVTCSCLVILTLAAILFRRWAAEFGRRVAGAMSIFYSNSKMKGK